MKYLLMIFILILSTKNTYCTDVKFDFYCLKLNINFDNKSLNTFFESNNNISLRNKIENLSNSKNFNELSIEVAYYSNLYNLHGWFLVEFVSNLVSDFPLSRNDKVILQYCLLKKNSDTIGLVSVKNELKLIIYLHNKNGHFIIGNENKGNSEQIEVIFPVSSNSKFQNSIIIPELPCNEILFLNTIISETEEFKWAGDRTKVFYYENHPDMPIEFYEGNPLSNLFESSVIQVIQNYKTKNDLAKIEFIAKFIYSSMQYIEDIGYSNQGIEGAFLSYIVTEPTIYLSLYELIKYTTDFGVYLLQIDKEKYSVVVVVKNIVKNTFNYYKIEFDELMGYSIIEYKKPNPELILIERPMVVPH